MTAEYQSQTEIKKPDEKWQASRVTKTGAVIAVLHLGAAMVVPDPVLKKILAGCAASCATADGICLTADAIVGSIKKKEKRETAGKQKSS